MESIFVFKENGEYQGLILKKDAFTHPLLKDFDRSDFYLKKEIIKKDDNERFIIMYKEQQSFDDSGFIQAVRETLERKGFLTYLFDEKKKGIADLLLSASLEKEERFEFFDYLVALSPKKVLEMKKGIEEDLRVLFTQHT